MQQGLLVFNQTVIHPVALIATLIAGALILALPRRWAIAPFLAAAIFIPIQQQIVFATLDFRMLRFLIVFAWLRVIMRPEEHHLQLTGIDKIILLWAIAGAVIYTLLWQTSEALVYRLGIAFDALGIFFFMRSLLHELDDISYVIKTLALICVPLAIAMLVELITGRNAFAVFGGVPEITIVRDDRLRCQGAFAHPILAGTFGASLFPLFLALWWQTGKAKTLAITGSVAAAVIMLTSSSSGPILTCAAGVLGLLMWFFRRHMRLIQWGLAFMVIALHLAMKAPVWALMMRVNVFDASTAYHRYFLFDQFIRRFAEWMLLGTQTTANWGYYLFDITNQYVVIGVEGGLLTLALFLAIIALGFKGVGRACQLSENPEATKIGIWALGASLLAHVVSFMGVSYFDQIIVIWYALLAMISTVSVLPEQAEQTLDARPGESAQNALANRPAPLPQPIGAPSV